MTGKRDRDEYLEQLWYMREGKKTSIEVLKKSMAGAFDLATLEELSFDRLVEMSPDSMNIGLTEEGVDQARQLIRAHRLAERLLHDVLGGEFEQGACEFEHTVSLELVDGICTLMGHPKECPHGLPIPEGECCRRHAKTALSFIIPLTELSLGQSARIAYVNCRNDQQIHKLDGMCIRPGTTVKLHQNYPAYVIECEGASIALDKDVAANICVWKDSHHVDNPDDSQPGEEEKPAHGFRKFINNIFSHNK